LVLKTGASATTAVTIDTSQNVGIGTASPARKLVVSNAGAQGFEFGAGVGPSSGNELLNYNRSTSLYVPLALYASTHTLYAGTAGDALAIAINSSGNVGINTASPTSRLTIGSGSFVAAEAQTTGMYTNGTSGLVILTDSLLVGTRAGADRLTLDASGNLGIGTATPAQKLTIASAGVARFYRSDNTRFGDIYVDGDGFHFKGQSTGDDVFIESTNVIRLYTAGTERARIDSSGNLAIGATSAASRLYVESTSTPQVVFRNPTGASYTSLRLYNDVNSSARALEIDYFGSSAGGGERAEIFVTGAYSLLFGTNNAERVRIDSSGNLLVGSTSFTTGGISRTVVINGASSAAVQYQLGGALASYVYAYSSAGFRVETSSSYAVIQMVPGGSGGVQLASTGATSWTSLSDERTKTDLVPITDATQKVLSLRAVTGRFIKDDPEKSRSFLIAQDFVDVFPQAVSTFKEKDDDTEYLGLAYTDTIPLLVAAIKEQQAIIKQLQADVAALKGTA
jgi:hypothetical protein